jgi:hypothetical protein
MEGEDGASLSIEETGYPAETAIVKEGNRELLRWQGTPVDDIQYQVREGRLMVLPEEEFYSALIGNEMTGTELSCEQGAYQLYSFPGPMQNYPEGG